MEGVHESDNVLFVTGSTGYGSEEFEQLIESVKDAHVKSVISVDGLESCEYVPFDVVVVKCHTITEYNQAFTKFLELLKPKTGILKVVDIDENLLEKGPIYYNLKKCGFKNVLKQKGSAYTCFAA